MTADTPKTNVQAGVPLSDADIDRPERVATGDRRDEVHYEPDPDQLVKVSALAQVEGPIPPEEQSAHPEAVDAASGPTKDVRMPPESSSVWDARPPADDSERSGNPTGH